MDGREGSLSPMLPSHRISQINNTSIKLNENRYSLFLKVGQLAHIQGRSEPFRLILKYRTSG